MMTIRLPTDSQAEIEDNLRRAAEDHGWSVVAAHDFPCKLLHEAPLIPHRIRIFELCHSGLFGRVLERNPAMAAVLPWRISVQPVEDGVEMSTVSPAALGIGSEDPELASIIRQMEAEITEIMNAAGRPRQKHHAGQAHAAPDPYAHEGALEGQMSDRGQLAQRIDRKGSKIEDLAGVGKHDAPGG